MDKEKYTTPETEIVEFETMSDLIVTSGQGEDETKRIHP